jgi:signal transduction histidine kinase
LHFVRDSSGRSGARFELRAPEDENRLRQLFEGIVDNAFKFGGDQPIEICVERRAEQARVTIVDHGHGILPADRRRIFERFERAAPANHFGGFGLGLWVARHLAEAHGGEIALSETPHGGTTVTVSLPLHVGASEQGRA